MQKFATKVHEMFANTYDETEIRKKRFLSVSRKVIFRAAWQRKRNRNKNL